MPDRLSRSRWLLWGLVLVASAGPSVLEGALDHFLWHLVYGGSGKVQFTAVTDPLTETEHDTLTQGIHGEVHGLGEERLPPQWGKGD